MAIEKGGIMFNRVIQRVLLAVSLIMPASFTYADNHESDNPFIGGGIAILDLVAEDPRNYVAMQRQNSEVFETLGANLAGVCTAVSGNEQAGEMQVYALFTSLGDAFNMWDIMLTNNQIRNIQSEFSSSRTLIGNQTWQIVKALEGEIFEESFATRVVDVSPTNPDAYVQAIRNMEQVYHENGFDQVQFDIYQPVASGVSGYYKVVVLAPSLRTLGDVFGALTSEQWAQDAYSLVTASRTELLSDKAYRCDALYASD